MVAARLFEAGIEDARREARLILAAALHTDAAGLLAADEVDEPCFAPLLARRVQREPVAYILGHREFWGLDFAVSPATLIPRPDSETLIEAALAAFPNRETVRSILDLGTGTGCLLLAALHEFPLAFGVGMDIVSAAAKLALSNAASLGVARRAAFFTGHWADAISAKFDLIFCNPPYISAAEMKRLMPEVRAYEPTTALAGGADGLAAYRAIIGGLPGLLAPSGAAILELGAGQAPAVAALAAHHALQAGTRTDLGGHARAMTLTSAK